MTELEHLPAKINNAENWFAAVPFVKATLPFKPA